MKGILALAILCAPASAAHLRITVYDKAHLRGPVVQSAFQELRGIFGQAGIYLELEPGDPAAPEGFLVVYSAAPGQQQPKPDCSPRRGLAVEILTAPPGVKEVVLGMALPAASVGLNARVYADHIENAARCEGRPYGVVLAHAMAHEIGHVLLQTNAHEKLGIMASVWTRQDYFLMTNRALLFTPEQSRRMRTLLRRPLCAAGTQSAAVGR